MIACPRIAAALGYGARRHRLETSLKSSGSHSAKQNVQKWHGSGCTQQTVIQLEKGEVPTHTSLKIEHAHVALPCRASETTVVFVADLWFRCISPVRSCDGTSPWCGERPQGYLTGGRQRHCTTFTQTNYTHEWICVAFLAALGPGTLCFWSDQMIGL